MFFEPVNLHKREICGCKPLVEFGLGDFGEFEGGFSWFGAILRTKLPLYMLYGQIYKFRDLLLTL